MASTSEVWTREFAQGALRADRYVPLPQTAIVPRAPSSDGKRVQIATFVSKAAVERLDLDTVRRRSKSRGVKGDLVLIALKLDILRDELRSVVAPGRVRHASILRHFF